MPKPFLPESTKQTITNGIDVLYEKLKQRLLGTFYLPQIRIDNINHDKTLTLPGLYTSAYLDADPLHRPTLSSVQSLASVAESYINASAEKTKAQALFSINNALKDAAVDENFNYEKELNNSLLNVFDQAHGEVKKVVETELQRAKTVGLQDGILDVMQSQGFDDPTVAFMTKKDAFVCKYCRDFFLHKDGITPKVYKLSDYPNCFLYGNGRVYTHNGFKKIKNVSFGDKVYTHQKRFRGVENTLNFLKVPYQGPYYEIKSYSGSRESVCVTPDHQVYTANGMKPISKVNQYNEKLIRMVKNCVVCYKPMIFSHPKYFCSNDCRNKAFGNLGLYVEKIDNQKFELEEFPVENLISHHHRTKPTFLYDITVKNDHSLVYNGLVTNNCRCIYDGDAEVIVSSGVKRLKNIEVNDYVLTHEGRFKKVLATFGKNGKMPNIDDKIYAVWYIDRHREKKRLLTTGDHLLLTKNGWMKVDQLTTQDKLIREDHGYKIIDENNKFKFKETNVLSVHVIVNDEDQKLNKRSMRLYDIQVEDDSSFIVNGIVSHNCLMIGVYPGFGFNSSGGLEYKSEGYDEYKHQNALGKSLMDVKQILEHDCNEHRDNELLAYLK